MAESNTAAEAATVVSVALQQARSASTETQSSLSGPITAHALIMAYVPNMVHVFIRRHADTSYVPILISIVLHVPILIPIM